jgi:hypothetical protein
MSRLLIIILVISILGNIVGLLVFYKFRNLKGYFAETEARLQEANGALKSLHQTVHSLTGRLDQFSSTRMIFLHHSVGEGILTAGGLRERLLDMGILVKSATYGDEIGQETDINNWSEKFRNRMDDILNFRAHPNMYNTDGTINDIVMFKSCFPNSNLIGKGVFPGDPSSPEKTIANFQASFENLGKEFTKYPDRLFVYLTAPPLIPELSLAENAARARQFNNWLINDFLPGYKKEMAVDNFVIFDLFDVLAGVDNFLKMEYRRNIPGDPHPNMAGSKDAARQFAHFFSPVWSDWLKK